MGERDLRPRFGQIIKGGRKICQKRLLSQRQRPKVDGKKEAGYQQLPGATGSGMRAKGSVHACPARLNVEMHQQESRLGRTLTGEADASAIRSSLKILRRAEWKARGSLGSRKICRRERMVSTGILADGPEGALDVGGGKCID